MAATKSCSDIVLMQIGSHIPMILPGVLLVLAVIVDTLRYRLRGGRSEPDPRLESNTSVRSRMVYVRPLRRIFDPNLLHNPDAVPLVQGFEGRVDEPVILG